LDALSSFYNILPRQVVLDEAQAFNALFEDESEELIAIEQFLKSLPADLRIFG